MHNYHLHAVEAVGLQEIQNVQKKCAAKQPEGFIYTYK